MFKIACVLAGMSAILLFSVSAASADGHKLKHRHLDRAERDCTPINGRYGYYGNPWCDTGSYRPPDIEFRQRQRAERRLWRHDHR
jgi:hypothetical protein